MQQLAAIIICTNIKKITKISLTRPITVVHSKESASIWGYHMCVQSAVAKKHVQINNRLYCCLHVTAHWAEQLSPLFTPLHLVMRFDSAKSHDKLHPIASNGTVHINLWKMFLHYFLPISLRVLHRLLLNEVASRSENRQCNSHWCAALKSSWSSAISKPHQCEWRAFGRMSGPGHRQFSSRADHRSLTVCNLLMWGYMWTATDSCGTCHWFVQAFRLVACTCIP